MSLENMQERELEVLTARFSKIVAAIESRKVGGMVMIAEIFEGDVIMPELILFGEQSPAALARQVGLLEHAKLAILSHLQGMMDGAIKGGISHADFADNIKNNAH